MDHAEARELFEIATTEPDGLERLMAGDTPDAALLAGHLAACAECTEELVRLRRAAAFIRPVIRSTPPPELRDRTLAVIAAVGRDRSTSPDLADDRSTPSSVTRTDTAEAAPLGVARSPRPRRFPERWAAAIAALMILAIAGTAVVVGTVSREAATVAALERITDATMRVAAEPDARRVALTAAAVSGASGALLFSPSSRELVVVSSGLPPPAAGREFRCWVEIDGQREPVGRMYFAGDVAFWIGSVDAVADVPAGARFGVTLADTEGSALDGDPAIVGDL